MDTKERMYIVLQKRDVSQSELAKKTGTTRQTINSYIHGRHQMRLEAIVLIASTLHVSVDYLLGLNEKEEVASQQCRTGKKIYGDCYECQRSIYCCLPDSTS